MPLLRSLPLSAGLLLAAFAAPALAEDPACRARIDAMFDGGPLDPFARPPHRFVNTVQTPEGATQYQFLVIWDGPARGISGIVGSGPFTLMIDSDTWTGPGPDGPWTAAPNLLPADHEAVQRRQLAESRANLADVACLGTVEVEGARYDAIRYFTKTDPDPETGAWFGALNTVYLDPASQHVRRWELTGMVSSFAPEASRDRHVQVFSYDDPVSISRPD